MNEEIKSKLITFLVSEGERQLISEKMQEAGISSLGAYLRKMAIDGYIIKVNLKELNELRILLSKTSTNINQIAKRVNSTGNIYREDIIEIQNKQEQIWNLFKHVLKSFSSFH